MTAVKTAEEAAAAISGREWRLLVGGDLRPAGSGRTFATESPATGVVIAQVPDGGAEDVDAAVGAGESAWPEWSEATPRERAGVVRELAGVLRDNADELATLDALDAGMPIRGALKDVELAAATIELFCDYASVLGGATVPASRGNLHFTTRMPFGVVGRIVPFNHPLMFTAAKMAAPLVAGNSVVVKPPEQAPLSALRLGELLADRLPGGVLSIVVGSSPETGRALVRDPRVHRIGFIGSERTGRAIQRDSAETGVKDVTLELGGKNALIVFPDADLAATAAGVVAGMNFTPSVGQSCGSTSRVVVHRDVHDELVAAVVERVGQLRLGDPLDPDTDIGPLAFRGQYDKTVTYLDVAVSEGATVAAGGGRPPGEGFTAGHFFEPTVLTGVRPHMRIAQEEVFGPLLSVLEFASEADAIAIANGVGYGLTGSIWTRDLDRAHRVATALRTGYVWINGASRHFLGLPFGGVKASGVGREECLDELLSYTQLKSTHIMLGGPDV